jgi:hypothetical protein
LLALLLRAGAAEEEPLQHRESRDSYIDAYQQSHLPQKQQNAPQDSGYPVYSAPVPAYGPAKEEPMKKDPNVWYGVPHFHHHYTVPDAPPPTEMEPDKGHGGFELTTVLKFLLKMVFLKLLVKKIYLIMTLMFLPKIKLLDWLWEKKKKPTKPTKPSKSSEEHNDDLEEDDDEMNFFRSSRGLAALEKRVVGAIDKQDELNKL